MEKIKGLGNTPMKVVTLSGNKFGAFNQATDTKTVLATVTKAKLDGAIMSSRVFNNNTKRYRYVLTILAAKPTVDAAGLAAGLVTLGTKNGLYSAYKAVHTTLVAKVYAENDKLVK